VASRAAVLTDFDNRAALEIYPHIPNSHVPPRLTTAFRMPGIDAGIGMSAAGSPSELGEVSGDETELITVASARSSNFEARHVVQSDSMN